MTYANNLTHSTSGNSWIMLPKLIARWTPRMPQLTKRILVLTRAQMFLSQKDLSTAVDKAAWTSLFADSDPARQAHLSLLCSGDSDLWLHASPTKAGNNIVEPTLYSTMLKRRLRALIFDDEFHCPFCDGVMDRFADHALTCTGGGDRTKRHNAIRNCTTFGC